MAMTIGFLSQAGIFNTAAYHSAYAGFSAGNIISDYVMGDYNSMSEVDIYNFLKSKNACNDTNLSKATYYSWHTYHIENGHFVCMADESFDGESAAHIIWQAAQDYRINPKVLIVLLQKEQGLVTDTWPNFDLQYRSATGYGCPDNAECDTKYYGFKNQVREAAKFFRKNLDGDPLWTNYPVGYNSIAFNPDAGCGSSVVYVENLATGALYTYTPYQPRDEVLNNAPGSEFPCSAYGNSNFYRYYTDWFGDTHYTMTSSYVDENDTFALQSAGGLYIVPSNDEMGARLETSGSASDDWRKYKFERMGDYYVVRHVKTNYVLDVDAAGTTDGTDVQIWEYNGTCAQKWNLTQIGNGVALQSACSGKYLDIYGAYISEEGVGLQIWMGNGSIAQNIKLIDLTPARIINGTYVFETVSEKAIDIVDGGTWNGNRTHIFSLTYSQNQQFNVVRDTDGLYTITNVAASKVLDVAGGGTDNGTAVQLWDSNKTCAQKWIAKKIGEGYSFLNACSKRAIDIPAGLIWSTFQQLQIYDANSSAAQIWTLKTPVIIDDGEYTIVSALNNKSVVDISGGAENSRDGTNINLYSPNNTNAQKFTLKYNKNLMAYQIISTYAKSRVLDVAGGSTSDGANVQMWNNNQTCAQFWRLRRNNDNTYNIISTCSDNVLDVSAGNPGDSTNIQLWDYNGSKAQKWILKKI